MENLTFENILLAFFGMCIHILIEVLDRRNKTIPISLSYFISDVKNYIRVLLCIISIITLLICADELADIIGITLKDGTGATKVFSFLTGYFNHHFVRYIIKIFRK
jgi:hypothetical protein